MNSGEIQQSIAFLEGLKRYFEAPVRTHRYDAEKIQTEGTTELYRFSALRELGAERPPLVFVPSLINRSYIFDLTPERSMLLYFREAGYPCYLLDWNDPGKIEAAFGMEDYVTRVRETILRVERETGERPIVVGYCMGGLLAMAASLLVPDSVRALSLLATPWRFVLPKDAPHTVEQSVAQIRTAIEAMEVVPSHLLYLFFYALDPKMIHEKFQRFASMDPESEEAKAFVAVEQWLQYGVPLAKRVAATCFVEWPSSDTLAQRRWVIDGVAIDPTALAMPLCIGVAVQDRIIPKESSQPLVELCPRATLIHADAGHIGLVASRRAREGCWNLLAEWMASV